MPEPSVAESSEEGAGAMRVFDSPLAPADSAARAQLERGVRGIDLAAAPVILPDFHHKQDLEMPSSIAVATRETIHPIFTSSSVNCGMALIALNHDAPPRKAIADFYRRVRERYPYPPTSRRELTVSEVVEAAARGAEFAADRFGISSDELERVEEGGRINLEPFGGEERLRGVLPLPSLMLSRQRFGTIGPSNHFIELQVVEELYDTPVAQRLGLRLGQLVLHYHAGGGVLAGQVGRLFGRRKKASRALRLQMAIQRPIYHFASARSAREIRARLQLYFSRGPKPVPRSGPEGRRLLLANAGAMNYAFAFRMATYANLRRLADQAFGRARSRLIVDSPHNSIYLEQVNGEPAVVHRHNACRAYPASRLPAGTAFGEVGQALLLPGTNQTSSFLCVAGDKAEGSLYSACHGAGTMIEDFRRRGLSGPDPKERVTLRFRYSGAEPEEVPQLDDAGVNAALEILAGNGLVRPVSRMRPLAVLT